MRKGDEKPRGWSINIMRTERHYRVGDCLITYNSLMQGTRYMILGEKKLICFKNYNGELTKSYDLTLEKFREVFIAEKMKAESKLGQLL
jgi:hypothetical protein